MNKLKHKFTLRLSATLLVASVSLGAVFAQQCSPDKATVGKPWQGERGITETVDQIMSRANNEVILGAPRFTGPEHGIDQRPKVKNPNALPVSSWPPKVEEVGIFAGRHGGPFNPQLIGTTFTGPGLSDSGFVPPDTMFDVGPSQILVCVNGRIRVYDKTGALGALNTTTDSFFNSVRNGSGTSDPFVRFDRLSNRWFVSIINVSSPNRVMLAVSSGPTITGTGSFTFFQFQHDIVGGGGNSDLNGFCDYASMGIDDNAVYIGGNIFNGAGTAFLGSTGYVIRKSALLTGSLVVTAFRQMCTGSAAGPYAPRGVDQDLAATTEGYFIGVDSVSFSLLQIRRISNPGGTPTISANIPLSVPTTVFPQGSITLGSTSPLDALDDRLFQARMHRNRLTGLVTLWTSHNIEVNASGVANASGNRNASRWYEIQNMTGTPSLRQSGTLFDPAASNPRNYFIPSVMMSGQGHMALGATFSGAADRAGIATAGRFGTDTLGSIQAPTIVQTSSTSYNTGSQGGKYRWGDYSATNVDPTDDMTMWSIQEYCNGTNSWGTRVFKLIAPPPATVNTLTPNSLAQGATANIVVTGTSTSGSGWFDTEAGMNRLAALFSGSGVTVNTVTFTNPTSVTLNVTVTGGATVGARNLTITNPDGQALTANNVFTVTAGNNPVPTISSLSPNTRAAGLGAFTLTVNGTNFVAGGVSTVRWNGSDRTTTFVNATQLTASITAADVLLSGTNTVTVFNTAPGGGTSNNSTFTVTKGSAQAINPGSVVTTIGFEFSGGLTDILTSNNAYYQAFNDDVSLMCQVEVQTNSAPDMGTLGQVDFLFETSVGRPGLSQSVSLYNQNTGLYEDLSSGVAPVSDVAATISVTTNANRFVNNANQNARARFTWAPINDEDPASDGWVHSVDRATWSISP